MGNQQYPNHMVAIDDDAIPMGKIKQIVLITMNAFCMACTVWLYTEIPEEIRALGSNDIILTLVCMVHVMCVMLLFIRR